MRAAKIGKVSSPAPLWGNDHARASSGPQAAGATKFRAMICFMLLFACSITSNIFAQTASPQESAKSVVKITSRFAGGKVEVGTGFVWSQPDYVVTALHVVAGAANITVYSEALKKEREADVINVHQESDLALLKLKTNDLPLVPLKISSAPPNFNDVYHIWGYPHDVNTMLRKGIEFSPSLDGQQATMGSIFKSEAHFETVVGKQGYPKYQAKILRVVSTIQPGQSGAPIFDKNGAVVGIGDGGLRQGIALINWAIPAQIYVASLPASKDPKPAEPSKQANLYSASSSRVEVQLAAPTSSAQSASATQHELVLAWSASLADILATAEAADADNSGLYDDLLDRVIDVYEDYETGATIAVPQGTKLSFNSATRMVEARSAGGNVRMFVQIIAKGGEAAQEKFDRYLAGLKQWQPDTTQADEFFEDEDYSEVFKSRVTFNEDEEVQSDILITLIVDDGNFLGTAVMTEDDTKLSDEDLNMYLLMQKCVELADFAID